MKCSLTGLGLQIQPQQQILEARVVAEKTVPGGRVRAWVWESLTMPKRLTVRNDQG